jgi:hypothetical protein
MVLQKTHLKNWTMRKELQGKGRCIKRDMIIQDIDVKRNEIGGLSKRAL